MTLGNRLAIMSDVHGERRLLAEALARCREGDVQSIILLGDLFDRVDQAEACALKLAQWDVAGVLGNHEIEALRHAPITANGYNGHTRRLLESLGGDFLLDDALFVHDELDWKSSTAWRSGELMVRVIFAGHTHYRAARDEHGPLDITLGSIRLRHDRRYLINPGAVVEGQFAIWDRVEETVTFERVS
jgi:predicted phosphodiesterase